LHVVFWLWRRRLSLTKQKTPPPVRQWGWK
jgi:hypothetical protein